MALLIENAIWLMLKCRKIPLPPQPKNEIMTLQTYFKCHLHNEPVVVCMCLMFFLRNPGASLVSTASSISWLAFTRSQVQFSGPAHSFTCCQLLVKGWALSTGYLLRSSLPRKSEV